MKGKGRGRPRKTPVLLVPVRLDLTPEEDVKFHRLATALGVRKSPLARRLVQKAIAAGVSGTISMAEVQKELDCEYEENAKQKARARARAKSKQ